MGSLSVVTVVCCCVVLVSAAPWRNYEVRQSQVCGDKLADMLSLICSGRGYNFAFKPEGASARRFRRGIVEECCRKSCTPALLELYCRADSTEPPSNVQIRKRSDISGQEISEETSPITSPTPATDSPGKELTTGDSLTTTATKGGVNGYRILDLLASSGRSTNRIGSTPNDTMEDEPLPPLRHHKSHRLHHRKYHSRKASAKTKRDKNLDSGSTKTFEIGTVRPYFAGRAFASYRSRSVRSVPRS